jgi:hypothetical protein
MKNNASQKVRTLLCSSFVSLCFLCLSAEAQWIRWDLSAGGNGHWYKAVPGTSGLTWSIASQSAHDEGGYLATITSAEENNFVFSLVDFPQFWNGDNGSGPALGGLQQDGAPEPAGGWYWASGEPWTYSNWVTGQPDNNGNPPLSNEDRLEFYSGSSAIRTATWNDINRDNTNLGGYVIERDDDPMRPTAQIYTSVEICWGSQTNLTYQVLWASSLDSTNWSNLGAPVLGMASETCVFDSIRGRQQRFYRIEVMP